MGRGRMQKLGSIEEKNGSKTDFSARLNNILYNRFKFQIIWGIYRSSQAWKQFKSTFQHSFDIKNLKTKSGALQSDLAQFK